MSIQLFIYFLLIANTDYAKYSPAEWSYLAVLFIAVSVLTMAIIAYYPYRFLKERQLTKQQKALRHEKIRRVKGELSIERNRLQTLTIEKRLLDQETQLLEMENQILRLEDERRTLSDRFFAQTHYRERIHLTDPQYKPEHSNQLTVFSLKEIPQLQEALNALYKNFTVRLQTEFPSLKERDIIICCLVKAGAKTRHLAELVSMTPNAVTKKKRQILAKMNILTITEDLELYLEQF